MLCPLRLDIEKLTIGSPPWVDADVMKRHVRVDFDDDDALLDVYTMDSIEWAESFIHRTIALRSHVWTLKAFEDSVPYAIRLPRGKTVSIESIAYSTGGSLTTLTGPSSSPAGTDYQEDLGGDSGALIMPARGSAWPSTDRDVPAPVKITFTAGYAPNDIPPSIMHAIWFGIADAYDLRGTQDFNPAMIGTAGERLSARHALLSAWWLPRIY